MKNILLLIFLISICMACQTEFDKDKLKFEIHKFHYTNNKTACCDTDFNDYQKILIDSIKKISAEIYLQEKVNDYNLMLVRFKSKKGKYKPNVYNETVKLIENKIDSVKFIYKNINKAENYYKCYFSYGISNTSFVIMLNEQLVPIECDGILIGNLLLD